MKDCRTLIRSTRFDDMMTAARSFILLLMICLMIPNFAKTFASAFLFLTYLSRFHSFIICIHMISKRRTRAATQRGKGICLIIYRYLIYVWLGGGIFD